MQLLSQTAWTVMYDYYLTPAGLTLSLDVGGYDSIPTDGSGRILITDIGDSNERALICTCHSGVTGSVETSDWYLHPSQLSINESDVISSSGTEGWETNRATSDDGVVVRLMRVSDSAKEGVFTCHITGCNNSPVSVGVYYPSESVTGVCMTTV